MIKSHMFRKPLGLLCLLNASAYLFMVPVSGQSPSILSNPEVCFQNDFYDCSTCTCNLSEPVHDSFILVLHFIFLIISLLFLFSFFFVQDLRRQPGSIVIALTIASLLYSLSTLVTNFNHIFNESVQTDNDTLCISFGYANYAMVCLTFLYQTSFFTFHAFSKRYQEQNRRGSGCEYHFVPIVLTAFTILFLYSQNAFGRTISGTCGVKTSASVVIPILAFGLLIGISLSLVFLMKRSISTDRTLPRSVARTKGHYVKYLIVSVLIYFGLCILNAATAIYIGKYDTDENSSIAIALNIMEVFSNLLQIMSPSIIIISWIRDSKSKEPLQRYLGTYRWINWVWNVKSSETSEDISDDEQERIRIDNQLLNGGSIDVTPSSEEEHFLPLVDIDSKEFKMNMVFSIMVGIRNYWNVQKKSRQNSEGREQEGGLDQQRYYKGEAKITSQYPISADGMKREIPHVLDKILIKDYQILEGLMTAYAGNIFREINELDEMGKFIQLSLDVNKNLSKIIKTGINPEGRSTAFNFTSSDNKLIFRSITDTELALLLKILPYYIMYLKSNQHSLLSRILGAFTFQTTRPQQKINFIVIKNVNMYPSHDVERTYELKGVTRFRRTVMEDLINKSELKNCGMLKDGDFNNFENSIRMGADIQSRLLATLRRDIHFLISQDLIDYSLSLSMVRRGRLPSVLSDVLEAEEQLETSIMDREHLWRGESIVSRDSAESGWTAKYNPYLCVESTKEDVEYVMGIVDFLKEYNMSKKVNIWLRKWGIGTHQDLTSEHPRTYGRRLINYLERIIES